MIFDTRRKAEAKAPAHLTTKIYYIMKDTKRKRLRLHIAAIQNFLTTLWIAGDSLVIVVRIEKIDHSV